MQSSTEVKVRPIIFSTEMVREILEWRKSMTRRINYVCNVGDQLWVREAFAISANGDVMFRASTSDIQVEDIRWVPSIHMPRDKSRIMLEATEVREEYLQNISDEDIIAEGIQAYDSNSLRKRFITLWDSINGERIVKGESVCWEANPVVDVIGFRVLDVRL